MGKEMKKGKRGVVCRKWREKGEPWPLTNAGPGPETALFSARSTLVLFPPSVQFLPGPTFGRVDC